MKHIRYSGDCLSRSTTRKYNENNELYNFEDLIIIFHYIIMFYNIIIFYK